MLKYFRFPLAPYHGRYVLESQPPDLYQGVAHHVDEGLVGIQDSAVNILEKNPFLHRFVQAAVLFLSFTDPLFDLPAICYVSYVALNYLIVVFDVGIAHEFYSDLLPVPGLKWEILVPYISFPLQSRKCGLGELFVLERAYLPKLLPQEFRVRISKQLRQMRVDVDDVTGDCIQD